MNLSTVVDLLSHAAVTTLELAGATLAISTVLALVLALGSISRFAWLRLPIMCYSWLFRSTPPLILLLISYYGSSALGFVISPFTAALIALVLYSTSFSLEILRGGFLMIDRGQYEASRALGLSYTRTTQRIILPQVTAVVTPAFLTNCTLIVKDTSLASVVAVTEIVAVANRAIVAGANPFKVYLVAAAFFLVINSIILGAQVAAERRWKVR